MTGDDTNQEPVPAGEDLDSSTPAREDEAGNFLLGLLYGTSFAVLIWCVLIVLIKVLVAVTG